MGYENQQDPDCSEFVEVDPTGRYGRYNEILGKGSSKIVYRAFDEYEGIEVAWNQVRLYDFLQSPEELERLYCEIHLLKTLKHKNIMKFYASWVDTSNRNINFVTEMFTSGTLRQYRHKHRRVNLRAVKHWCRQILEGLLYLHSHNPPIIHRDLKCDNIFINGNQGEVKIGDLGLAAILRKSHAARCVGTPEFMAPEIYEEQYNELADIYSFGMCILEMVTFEYPYSECTHSAQIYKKVISGRKPEALDKVQDPEVRHFVEKCLATVSQRLPAKELLKDPFLQIDDLSSCLMEDQFSELGSLIRQPFVSPSNSNIHRVDSWCRNGFLPQVDDGRDYDAIENGQDDIELFSDAEDDFSHDVDIAIEGRMREDGHIFFWFKIADIEGRVRHIHFVFDLDVDTALSVATELVEELDITDYDVTVIAEMIDGEILSMVPDWKPGPAIDETLSFPTPRRCPNCDSNGASCASPIDHHSGRNLCSRVRCQAVTHGRFEEVTYKEGSSQSCTTEGASELSRQIGILNMTEKGNCTDSESERVDPVQKHRRKSSTHSRSTSFTKEPVVLLRSGSSKDHRYLDKTEVGYQYPPPDLPDDYENEIRKELRWLKAKYQMEPRDYQNQQLGEAKMHSSSCLEYEEREANKVLPQTPPCSPLHSSKNGRLDSMHLGMRLSSNLAHGDRHPTTSTARPPTDINDRQYSAVEMFRSGQTNANRSMESSYSGLLLPGCLPRTKSLPVDAVDA